MSVAKAMINTWVTAFYSVKPDSSIPAQSVSFGTSGHRGSSLTASFNELHILAIAQAVVDLAAIRQSGLKLGVDPMGGTGLTVWQALAADAELNITVVNSSLTSLLRH